MKRREFVVALGGAAISAPLDAWAQRTVPIVGVLSPFNNAESTLLADFRAGLREYGYVDGQNIVIEWRFANGNADRLPGLAAELVRLNVDCILVGGADAALAAKRATSTIPIVMGNTDDDPVRLGLVASLARPGGNVTGFINMGSQLAGKRLELLK